MDGFNGNDREIEWYIKERKMSFSERWSAFWGDEVDFNQLYDLLFHMVILCLSSFFLTFTTVRSSVRQPSPSPRSIV